MADAAPISHPFDSAAPRYDATFTDRQLGRWLREVVWRELTSLFNPGDTVVDLGCGTGEDACYLAQQSVNVVATDASAGMLDVARSKALRRGVSDRVILAQLDLRSLAAGNVPEALRSAGAFDGVYADFGPLNCLPDRRSLARVLTTLIRPGGTFIAVMMGPVCPWEVGWYLIHGHPRTALRRFRGGAGSQVGDGIVSVWYPSSRRLRSEFAPSFVHVKTIGMGFLLPPSDLGHLIQRAPRLFRAANGLEERLRGRYPWTWLNDHYLSVYRSREEI